jgi:hypothetical protein
MNDKHHDQIRISHYTIYQEVFNGRRLGSVSLIRFLTFQRITYMQPCSFLNGVKREPKGFVISLVYSLAVLPQGAEVTSQDWHWE